ncbi:MAG: DNA polymerase III subunit alpha [Bacillota bacterium]
MGAAAFNHLHLHTEFSLLDGAARIEQVVPRAAAMGMSALAITDHGVMYGVVPFYQACLQHGVKPILGCEVYVARRTRHDRQPRVDEDPHHLVLLARDQQGYRNLMRLVSLAHMEGFYYRPRVDWELLERHHGGLIALSACLAGEVPRAVLEDGARAREIVARYRDLFGADSFYLEVQENGLPTQRQVNRELVRLAREMGVGLVATNDVHYLEQADARMHDVLLCIQTQSTVDDPGRLRFGSDQFYLRSPQEMGHLFRELPEALGATVEIAENCQVELRFGQLHLPQFPVPEGETEASYLRHLCYQRLPRRYPQAPPEVMERLEYELSMIERMGYPGYFLIVWDFVEFARQHGIPVGPGRGSAAGSLVAYVLGITDVDPLRHGLLFERFLNPERVSMPDMDIDFCFERRDEVIRYVVGKYGQDCVAQIVTFGTMKARAAIRDVGRALGLPYGEVDRIAKMVPPVLGITLDQALETSPDLAQAYRGREEVREVVDLARQIEGMPRHASVHAAGVVIAPEPLIDLVPLQKTPEGAVVTQFPMEVLEELGLLKMDFLGLRNLTVIDHAVKLVGRTGEEVDWHTIPLDDPAVYALLSRGETLGIFQLEAGWVQDLLRQLRPATFEDIVAIVALVRPGPMEQIPEYQRAKQEGARYLHPSLEPILKDTYGVMIYQEQVMQVVSQLAGFTLAQADILRRGMAKKKPELVAAQRVRFIEGAVSRGVDRQVAEQVFSAIERFAGYAFNRSHAAAYALLAYRTAYLKAHYPLQYMVALLTSVMDSTDDVAVYVEECRRLGVTLLPPDVNRGELEFSIEKDASGRDAIRFGLGAIKNLGRAAIESILRAREQGPFRSLHDFCERVDTRHLNRRAVESLIKAGAFDSLGAKRAQLLGILDQALERGQGEARGAGQLSFFDLGAEEFAAQDLLPDVPEFPQAALLAMEKEVLGLYLSGHPLDPFRPHLEKGATHRCADLHNATDGSTATVGGVVLGVKRISTRAGEPMGFVELEDTSGHVEVVVFPRVFEKFRGCLVKDAVVLVKGTVQRSEGEEGQRVVKLMAEEVIPLACPGSLVVELRTVEQEEKALRELKGILARYPGSLPVRVDFVRRKKAILVEPGLWVEDTNELRWELQDLLGDGAVYAAGEVS